MRWRDQEMTAIGIARLNLSDSNVTNVGDELAVARALSNLADLFAATASDIHAATHEPVVIVQ